MNLPVQNRVFGGRQAHLPGVPRSGPAQYVKMTSKYQGISCLGYRPSFPPLRSFTVVVALNNLSCVFFFRVNQNKTPTPNLTINPPTSAPSPPPPQSNREAYRTSGKEMIISGFPTERL